MIVASTAQYVLPVIGALLGLFGALVGALLAHRFTSERDRVQKRRELLLKYLLEIWQDLEIGSRDEAPISERRPNLERAIAMIQIFGSINQIDIANKFTSEMAKDREANTTPLLIAIRDELRKQLGLDQLKTPINWLRITLKDNGNGAATLS